MGSSLLLLCNFSCPRVFKTGVAMPHSPQELVPEGEEGLREIGLDAPALVVDIMVRSVVAGDTLERVPGERVSAVVVDSLDGRRSEKYQTLSSSHAGKLERDTRSQGIEKEALKPVVVQSAVSIGHIEAVVARVECCYRKMRQPSFHALFHGYKRSTYCTATYLCALRGGGNTAKYQQRECQ